MGDFLEFTTSTNNERNCYMISSGAFKFYLKGKGKAIIELESELHWATNNMIIIGNHYSWIDEKSKVKTTNIISEHKYRPFWISWYGKEIRVGKGDNPKPFLVKEKHKNTTNFILFFSLHNNTMYWKFRLPLKINEPKYKRIYDGRLKWVKMNGNCLPEDALIGGYENEVLYIMRAMHEKALTPGKFVPSKGAGYVAWGSDAHKKTDMEILCGYDSIWVPIGDKIHSGALVGGYTEYHETMFVGRALHNNMVIPGKIAPSHKVCYIPYKGKEIAKEKYEILVNKYFIY